MCGTGEDFRVDCCFGLGFGFGEHNAGDGSRDDMKNAYSHELDAAAAAARNKSVARVAREAARGNVDADVDYSDLTLLDYGPSRSTRSAAAAALQH